MKKLTHEPYTEIPSTAEHNSSLILVEKSVALNMLSKRRYFHFFLLLSIKKFTFISSLNMNSDVGLYTWSNLRKNK